MFEVGFSEMMVVFVIALIVLGPERLPKVARFIGFWIGRLRAYAHHAKEEFDRHMPTEEVRQFKTDVENTAYQLEYNLKNPHYQEMLRQQELNKTQEEQNPQHAEISPQSEIDFSQSQKTEPVNLTKNNQK